MQQGAGFVNRVGRLLSSVVCWGLGACSLILNYTAKSVVFVSVGWVRVGVVFPGPLAQNTPKTGMIQRRPKQSQNNESGPKIRLNGAWRLSSFGAGTELAY